MRISKLNQKKRIFAVAVILLILPALAHGRRNRHSEEDRETPAPASFQPPAPSAPMQPITGPAIPPPNQPGGDQGNTQPSQIFTWKDRNTIYATNDQRNIPPRFNKRLDPPDPKQLVVRMGSDTPPPPVKTKKKRAKKSRR